jgi:hypothetical protein
MKDERDALVLGQPIEQLSDFPHDLRVRVVVLAKELGQLVARSVRKPVLATAPASVRADAAERDAEEPRTKRRWLAQFVDRTKSVKEDVLQQVVEIRLRAEQARKKGMHGVDMPFVDARARVHVAAPCSLDQESIVVFDGWGEQGRQDGARFARPCGASNHGF